MSFPLLSRRLRNRSGPSVRRFGRATLTAFTILGTWVAGTGNAWADPSDLPPEVGYNYGEIETPRTAALGGAQRALSNSTSALFINPANMAASRVYHVGALAQIWPQANRQSYGAAAVDSIVSSSRLAGGLGGTWNRQDPDGLNRQYNDIRFALAMPVGDAFFAGLGGRVLSLNQDGPGPLGPSLVSGGLEDERILDTFNFDAGITIRPIPELSLAVVGTNLLDSGNGFEPLTFGGGVGYGTPDFSVEADVVADTTTWDETALRWMAGAEALVADHVNLRAGYRYDEGNESQAVSAGAGYVTNRFSVDAAVRQTVSGDSVTTIVFGFTLHVESMGLTPTQASSF